MNELHVTIGISGSGKSTIAARFARENRMIYISSDYLRSKYGTGEEDQNVNGIVFRNMNVFTELNLSQGFDVMLDATFTTQRERKEYLEIARVLGARRVAHFVNTPMHVAMVRNGLRSRQVPYDVIQRQAARLTPPQLGEFDEVILYEDFKSS